MTPMSPSSRRTVATATVVGRGRLGRVVARALGAAGIAVAGPLGRDDVVPPADVVLLCVPDGEIATAAAAIGPVGGRVGHMSGATPLGEAGVDFGLHPLQTFLGDEGAEAFHGIGCAVAGRSEESLEVARELAVRLGARPFAIADEQRAAYHAAASIASNFVVTMLAAAEEVAASTSLTRDDARGLLAPLVRSTVENWAVRGPESALTGPVARGDTRTVQRQRSAVAAAAPDLLTLFDTLCESTRTLAERTRSTV